MIAKARERWHTILDHPILQLELRRIRRKHRWPGRRFFLFYPVILGGALGCGVMVVLSTLLERLSLPISGTSIQLAALATGLPVVCLLGMVSRLLAFVLPWIAPALTATTIVHERELGTFDLLQATLLTEQSIVLGKLGGCLARLWPGILILALLTPFQLIVMSGSGLFGSPPFFSALGMAGLETMEELPWVWLLLMGVVELLDPWGDLALNAAVGLFVSALSNSSGMAIAASYGTIIAIRAALYLVTLVLNVALVTIPGATLISEAMMNGAMLDEMMMISSLVPLGMVLVKFAGMTLLVWGAIWRLERT
ncbi:MAG: hypothetical protein SXV54_01825 [Chloroflexota bacterium]|nr:hypothetical protein [Chloroflexota bacterium]